jgi:hypothetical protein
MADMFLLPFLPLAMRGMQMLMQHLPKFQMWGQRTADWIQTFIASFNEEGGVKGAFSKLWQETIRPWLSESLLPIIIEGAELGMRAAKDGIIGSIKKFATDKENQGKMLATLGVATVALAAVATVATGGLATPITAPLAVAGLGAVGTGMAMEGAQELGYKTNKAMGGQGNPSNVGHFNAPTGYSGHISQHDAEQWPGGFPGGANKRNPLWQGRSGGQFSPVIKRGDQVAGLGGIEEGVGGIMNSMEVSLARQSEKVKDYATQFQQKEVGAGGMLGAWDDEVLRGAIPETWDSISGMYQKMDDELTDEARNAALLSARSGNPAAGFDPGLSKVADEIGAALNRMTLSDFVLDPSVASEVENCFIIANQCINANWMSLAKLVESGVEKVQVGVGGQVMDLDAINALVLQGQKMGGVAEDMANQVATDLAQYVYEMSNENVPLTIDPKILSDQIIALQVATKDKVIVVKEHIIAATSDVEAIVATWDQMGHMDQDNEGGGWQFGGIGAAFGEAVNKASSAYDNIRNFTPKVKRRKQLTTLDQAWGARGLDEGLWEDSTYEQIGDTSSVRVTDDDDFSFASDLDTLQAYDDQFDAGQAAAAEAAAEVVEAAVSNLSDEQTAFVEAYQSRNDSASAFNPGDNEWMDSSLGYGEQFGSAGGGGGRRGVQNTSHSVMNISINTRASVQDILSDLRRVQHMDDASFFNSVS